METTRAGFLGGVLGGAAGLALPAFVSDAAAAAPAVLPGLEPGGTIPATLPTRQLLNVESFEVVEGYPEPLFKIHRVGGGTVGTLKFTHQRTTTGHGYDGLVLNLGGGRTAHHLTKGDATGDHRATGAAIAKAGGRSFRANFTIDVAASRGEMQAAYRLTKGTVHSGGKSRSVALPDRSLVLWPARGADFEPSRDLFTALEQAAKGVDAGKVFAEDDWKVLATLAADPLLMAYEALNPAFGAGLAGPWQLPSIFQCLDGRLVRQTPAAFAYYHIGCITSIAGPAFDESGVRGFRAPKL